jgi:hypothetical protein
MTKPQAAFYCVADERYFLGAVGMINSLRVIGHDEPVFMLDCGLNAEQRELLAPHATIVEAPRDAPPWLLKTIAPLRHPAEVMVLIDTDIVLTRHLGELIERAAEPRLVATENDIDRFVPEWGELLGLGAVRRQPYVSSALVVVGQPLGGEVLGLMDELQDRVDFDNTFWRANVSDYAFLYADQDVFNAILASRIEREALVALPNSMAPNPPFTGLRVVDAASLRVAHADGTEPYCLHNFYRKPWLVRTRSNPYSRLLTRLLLGPDVPLRLDPGIVPLRLRTGPMARLARYSVDVAVGVPAYVHRRVKPGPRGSRGWADERWLARKDTRGGS